MAFRPENMGVLSYCNGFTLWHYRSAVDDFSKIVADGYFTPFHKNLRKEDVVFFTENQNRTGRRRFNQVTPSMVTVAHLM